MDTSLRRKLFSIVILVTVVCLPPIVMGLLLVARLGDARELARQTDEAIEALADLEDSVLLRGGAAVERYVILGFDGPALVERYEAATDDTDDRVATLQRAVPEDFDDLLAEVVEAYDRLVPALDAVVSGEATAADLIAATDTIADTFEADAQLGGALDARVQDQAAEIDRLGNQLVAATLASLVLALLTASGGIYLVTNGLVRRMDRLSDNAARVLRTEDVTPQLRSQDEIGQLTATLAFAGGLLDVRRREALAATRAKDAFLARVSHELKTPLTAMIGFGQLLAEDPELSPTDRDDAEHIVAAGRHLRELIEELLDLSAIEAGKFAVLVEPVLVAAIAAEAAALVQPMADTIAVTLEVDCPDGLVVDADPRRLREIVLSLLSHAVKGTHKGGRAVLSVTSGGGAARIRVTNDGPGLPPDVEARLLGTSGRRDGTGTDDIDHSTELTDFDDHDLDLALALASNIIDAMGGKVGVDSPSGQGSTLWFELPTSGALGPQDDQVPARSAPAVPAPDGAGAPGTEGAAPSGLPAPTPARTRFGRRWMDVPLKRKLLSIIVLVTVACTPPILVGLAIDARLSDARAEVQETIRADDTLKDLRNAILVRGQSAIQVHVIFGYGRTEVVEAYRSDTADVPDLIADLGQQVPDDLDEPLAEAVDAYATALARYDRLMAIGPDVGPDEGSTEQLIATGDGTAAAFAADLRLADALDDRIADQRAEVERLQGQLVSVALAGLALVLLATGAGITIVTSGLVRRIEHLSETAVSFIKGRPMRPMTKSNDEIGRLNETMSFAGELLDARRREAQGATRAKDGFLSRVGYRLRNPLTAMIGFAELLEESPTISSRNRDDARQISRAGHHLHGLIGELLDIKAIEAGKLAIDVVPVSVAGAVDEAVSLLTSSASSRSITIAADCPDGLVVAADPRRLREVLLNLGSNAVKYNHTGGRVEVAAGRTSGAVRIAVTDTGPGISPQDQKRLFTPFERLAAADTDVEGTGVGLALTKNVVEAMGGTIGVDSEPGQGTTFWVDLPIPATRPHDEDGRRREAPLSSGGAGRL